MREKQNDITPSFALTFRNIDKLKTLSKKGLKRYEKRKEREREREREREKGKVKGQKKADDEMKRDFQCTEMQRTTHRATAA